jgi:hypothetical protein
MIVYATTPDGHRFPVIDVTDPAFTVDDSHAAIETLRRTFHAMELQRKRMPKFLMRYFIRTAARRSLLARALLTPQDAVLDSLTTYAMKLGAAHLPPPYTDKIDLRLAASPFGTAMRLRVQQIAKLAVLGLRPLLDAERNAPLHMINIGGGSAIDTLNALILLRGSSPEMLNRRVTIHVLDRDARGPVFGRNALAALSAEGAPLHGLDVQWEHLRYSWEDTAPLVQLIQTLVAQEGIIAASSEGALFEYPSDAIVVANLRALYAGGHGAKVVTGSVTRADELTVKTLAVSLFKLQPRGVPGFAALIQDTGFKVERVEPGLMGDQVLLRG